MSEQFDRDLMRGSLDLMVLSVLAEGATYGYELQKRLREASANRVRLEAGTLYPLLHRLESDKMIRAKWDAKSGRRRKWYELTAAGKRRLTRQANEWRHYAGCMNRLLEGVVELA